MSGIEKVFTDPKYLMAAPVPTDVYMRKCRQLGNKWYAENILFTKKEDPKPQSETDDQTGDCGTF